MKMTSFTPEQHGFRFDNQFVNDNPGNVFGAQVWDWKSTGLCGGWCYAALDYYFAQTPIPSQPFRPANGTLLYSYLYDRQVTEVISNSPRWLELWSDLGGARDAEFFNWGISTKSGEILDQLRQHLDAGIPAILGLVDDGKIGGHNVIAFGYDMGRYQGDLGPAFIGDFKIFVCNPNYPYPQTKFRTLVADMRNQVYNYAEPDNRGEKWRAYFVDQHYQPQAPPAIPNSNYPKDGLVYELVLKCVTGSDDMRGGNDNLDLVVHLMDGTQQVHPNINLGKHWLSSDDPPYDEEYAEVVLSPPLCRYQIQYLELKTTFSGGAGGDNWDMKSLTVYVLGGGFYQQVAETSSKRFTGKDNTLIVPVPLVRYNSVRKFLSDNGVSLPTCLKAHICGARCLRSVMYWTP